ncbi:MAG: hypothetical protein ACOZBL_01025 [Patescibacteria group bacterium]
MVQSQKVHVNFDISEISTFTVLALKLKDFQIFCSNGFAVSWIPGLESFFLITYTVSMFSKSIHFVKVIICLIIFHHILSYFLPTLNMFFSSDVVSQNDRFIHCIHFVSIHLVVVVRFMISRIVGFILSVFICENIFQSEDTSSCAFAIHAIFHSISKAFASMSYFQLLVII